MILVAAATTTNELTLQDELVNLPASDIELAISRGGSNSQKREDSRKEGKGDEIRVADLLDV